ncbi:MAG: hypothetical protein BM562_09350 [Alphaproteobacteria bacterium MedPE-SWcel]|nr:MAG: hypothetical protein BM562_09350 [Alphaproteobacteria bacterium MedPE-SWcel]
MRGRFSFSGAKRAGFCRGRARNVLAQTFFWARTRLRVPLMKIALIFPMFSMLQVHIGSNELSVVSANDLPYLHLIK